MNDDLLKRLARETLLMALDDCTGIWTIARDVREIARTSDDDKVRELSLDTIRFLLHHEYARIGDLADRSILHAWGVPAEDAIARVDTEWRGLGRDPDIGEVGWLENTPKGDDLIRPSG